MRLHCVVIYYYSTIFQESISVCIVLAIARFNMHHIDYNVMHGLSACTFKLCIQVDSAWALGNYEKAKRNANISKIFNIIGFIIGALLWLIAIISIIVSIVLVVNGSGTCSYGTRFECSYYTVNGTIFELYQT